jgi:DNA-binding beta-propeller fold protein YncE
MKALYSIRWLMVAVLAAVLAGCASTGQPDVVLLWPEPPDQPVVEYNRSILGTVSLERSFFGRVKDFLFGESPDHYFSKPYGVASDGRSKLYLADTGTKSIVILDMDAGTSKVIRSAGPRQDLVEPVNVIVDRAGNIYVADTGLGKVAIYDKNRVFLRYIASEGRLVSPVGMAIHEPSQRLYVVDSQQHQVHVFALDGAYVASFGGRGDERGEFYHPLGIAISRGDTIYVTDAFHFAVQAFDLEGNYIFSFGPRPRGVGTMARPRDVALDSDGHVYVTDALKHEVQVYDTAGGFLFAIGTAGAGEGQFRLPAGICITETGQIFVADSINRRVQEFVYLSRS